jgi:hypothetical protein
MKPDPPVTKTVLIRQSLSSIFGLGAEIRCAGLQYPHLGHYLEQDK